MHVITTDSSKYAEQVSDEGLYSWLDHRLYRATHVYRIGNGYEKHVIVVSELSRK